jgi:ribosomal protein L37AE/L43A
MSLKNPNRRPALLILDKDVLAEARRKGDNVSKLVRDLLRLYYADGNGSAAPEPVAAPVDNIEEAGGGGEGEEAPKKDIKPQTNILKKQKKEQASYTAVILCPECKITNVITRTAQSRKCRRCGFNIRREDFEFVGPPSKDSQMQHSIKEGLQEKVLSS